MVCLSTLCWAKLPNKRTITTKADITRIPALLINERVIAGAPDKPSAARRYEYIIAGLAVGDRYVPGEFALFVGGVGHIDSMSLPIRSSFEEKSD